jgi:DNA-binding transcriptional LysR family regulator
VTFPPGATTRLILERHFPEARIVMELSGIAAVLAFVRAGAGAALVSRVAVEADLARGALVEARHPATPLRREIAIVHRGVERLSPAAAAVRQALLATRPGRPGSRRGR